MSVFDRRRGREAGVTSLEVALTFGLFITLILVTIDLSLYFVALHNLTVVVAAAARAAQADRTITNCDGPPASWPGVSPAAPLLNPRQLSLCITQPFITLGVQQVTVTGTYTYQGLTPVTQALPAITETVTYGF